MSIPAAQDNTPVESREQLLHHCAHGIKPKTGLLIGTEHEKFPLDAKTLKPVPYEGKNGVRALLEGMTRFGFKPVMEGEHIVALERGRENITLEPAGQFELSGAPLNNLHESAAELERHTREVKEVAAELGLVFLPHGYHPQARVEDMPWMPKGRYKIMREYMPKVGKRGLEMMVLTCTTQVNLDYVSESDMARKMRASLCISPIVSALFANSPFYQGKPNGFATNRCAVWLDVDGDRSGIPAMAFESGFGFERYVDYALDVPMYFVLRGGKYINCAGQSFRDFLKGKLPALPGEKPIMADWLNHLTTLFPDVRLKTYLEMRSADVGNPAMIMALPAFWVGLYYDDTALNRLEALTLGWSHAEVNRLRSEVPKLGFKAAVAGKTSLEWARELVRLSCEGLARRAVKDGNGADETRYLDPLKIIVDSGKTQSARLAELYGKEWQGDMGLAYKALSL
ncbi:MAG: glutamate--cysteine ligase [Proteobacteria bacterium]|nr:glutamate--cysteine ligase [Pseudomonadota bacterium]